jgi:hypothetical protein
VQAVKTRTIVELDADAFFANSEGALFETAEAETALGCG